MKVKPVINFIVMAKDREFSTAKENTLRNLETIQMSLVQCVNEGMLDPDSEQYNDLLDLIVDARIVDNWDELLELATRGKTLEMDVAAFLARLGRTTVSLNWPRRSLSR